MTPREKATQIYNNLSNISRSYIEGKKCALYCVDEIIKQQPSKPFEYTCTQSYWIEVKEEIKKL